MKYNCQKKYILKVAGAKRFLNVVEIKKGKLWIASFVMLGDTELNYRCAKELIRIFPREEFDYLVVPEAKAIPIAQSICQILSEKGKFRDYIVLRKSAKAYMVSPLRAELKSITTKGSQTLAIDGEDARKVKGKKIYIIDDVISTGGNFRAMINLMRQAGADIRFAATVLKEGDFDISDIEDGLGLKIAYLQKLPVFEL